MIAGDAEPFGIVRPSDGRVLRTERSASADLVIGQSGWQEVPSLRRLGTCAGTTASRVFSPFGELVETHAAELVECECTVSSRLATEIAAHDIPIVAAMIRHHGE